MKKVEMLLILEQGRNGENTYDQSNNESSYLAIGLIQFISFASIAVRMYLPLKREYFVNLFE